MEIWKNKEFKKCCLGIVVAILVCGAISAITPTAKWYVLNHKDGYRTQGLIMYSGEYIEELIEQGLIGSNEMCITNETREYRWYGLEITTTFENEKEIIHKERIVYYPDKEWKLTKILLALGIITLCLGWIYDKLEVEK